MPVTKMIAKTAAAVIVILILLPQFASALEVTFIYDKLNRLTSATYGVSTVEYHYDSSGNMTHVVTPTGCDTVVYKDQDGDGYGDPAISLQTCDQAPGYVTDNTDCDDSDASAHPGQTWYQDVDGDGYYHGAVNSSSCTRPTGYFTADELTTIAVIDNAPDTYNPDQLDSDGDGVGDVEDAFPDDFHYSLDTDGDGIADAWEIANFGSLTTAGTTSDSDGDGITDLQEFLIDTDPHISVTCPWDVNGDGRFGLEEVIHSLQVTTGQR